MRHFRHLTKAEITEIIVRTNNGEKPVPLSREFGVDHSTINYHVSKYQAAYPEQGGVYALIKIQAKKTCIHPSSTCTLCGDMMDQLLREERDQIATLKRKLEDANSRLRVAGLYVE